LPLKKGATINEHQARITWLNEQADDMLVSQGPDEGPAEEEEPVVEEFYRQEYDGGASDSDNEDDTWRR